MPRTGDVPFYWKRDLNGVRYREYGNKDWTARNFPVGDLYDLLEQGLRQPLTGLEIRKLFLTCFFDLSLEEEAEDRDTDDIYEGADVTNWTEERADEDVRQLEIRNRQSWIRQLRMVLSVLDHQRNVYVRGPPSMFTEELDRYIFSTKQDVESLIRGYTEGLRRRNASLD